MHALVYADLLGVERQKRVGLDEVVAYHAHYLVVHAQVDAIDAGALYCAGSLARNRVAGGAEHLAGFGVHYVLGGDLTGDAVFYRQLFVELIGPTRARS